MLPATKANRARVAELRDTDTLVARFLIAHVPPLPRSCPIEKSQHLRRAGPAKDVRTRPYSFLLNGNHPAHLTLPPTFIITPTSPPHITQPWPISATAHRTYRLPLGRPQSSMHRSSESRSYNAPWDAPSRS